MNIDKVFPRAAAIALLVQLVFWTPISVVFFVPEIQDRFPPREAALIGIYVGTLPMLVFLGVLVVGLLQER